jgi:DNA-binding response OmpR family regulator
MLVLEEADLSGLRILVVEDSLLVADVLSEALRDHGCTVVGPVPRLEQGLALANGEQLDCALLDVNLAGKRCFPIAAALAARGIPFAFLTGYGEAGIPVEYRGTARLTKPFNIAALVDLVGRSLGLSGLGQQ